MKIQVHPGNIQKTLLIPFLARAAVLEPHDWMKHMSANFDWSVLNICEIQN